MVDPVALCDQHLLGEHFECHMVAGSLAKGYHASIRGLVAKSMLEPQNLQQRHDRLAEELTRRGFKHGSPLPQPETDIRGNVSVKESRDALMHRCPKCLARMN